MVDRARKLINEKVKQGGLPPGMRVGYSYDESKYIRQVIADLENNMFTGFILVIAVTIFFLGFVNSLFVSLAIPFSMLLSFFIIDMLGITMNIIVLFSLILALGMLVDNGIVLVDYTNILVRGGMPPPQAVVEAGKTRLRPVLLTAITTVLCLLPMAFGVSLDIHPGTAGIQVGPEMSDFWKAFAWAVVYGLSFATVMTLVMVPCMLSIYFRIVPPKVAGAEG
jgi:multidrug efflux pump